MFLALLGLGLGFEHYDPSSLERLGRDSSILCVGTLLGIGALQQLLIFSGIPQKHLFSTADRSSSAPTSLIIPQNRSFSTAYRSSPPFVIRRRSSPPFFNLLVDTAGVDKLTDFGLAKHLLRMETYKTKNAHIRPCHITERVL
ncbi:hypothetical protein RIF29_38158 [Crotalaria pallida]|uniref:Uncharacterized protein n=1 Tax=Crotalaria pallida TaxID=3830 RepID=A0AAN9DZF6_CROPI